MEVFGGEEGLTETRKRDEQKRALRKANGVAVLYFKYNEDIGIEAVEKKLRQVLKRRQR